MMAAQRETVGLAPAGRPPKSSFISIVSLVSESPLLLNAQSGPGWEVSNAPLARGYCPPEPCAPPAPWFYSIPEWAGVPARAVAQQAPTHTLGHFPHPTTIFSAMCGTRHRVSALSVRVAGREETACAPRLPLKSDFPTIATITFPPSGGGAPNAKGGR